VVAHLTRMSKPPAPNGIDDCPDLSALPDMGASITPPCSPVTNDRLAHFLCQWAPDFVLPRAPGTSHDAAHEQLTRDYRRMWAAELPFSGRLVTRIAHSKEFRYPPAAQCLHGLTTMPFCAFLRLSKG